MKTHLRAPNRLSISVVIPNYNHARLIPRAITALLRQQYAPQQIIIVDDGSIDDSIAVIEELRKRAPSIWLIRHETNLGAPAALNTGLHAATGDLVYFAAADDFSLPGLFASAAAALKANPRAAYFCACAVLINPDGRIVGYRPFMWPAANAAYLSPRDVRSALRGSDNWAVGSTVVWRRHALATAGGFDETMGALCDGMVVRKLALEDGCCFDPAIGAAWEVYPDSFSARSALTVSENIRLVEKATRKVKEAFPVDMREAYAGLLSRRLRFNMARLWLTFGKGVIDAEPLAAVAKLGAFDRGVLRLLAYAPVLRKTALLGWLFLRLRPYHVRAIAEGWWRARTLDRKERRTLDDAIREARSAAGS